MYKYVKLLFVFLVPLLVTTCSDDPGGLGGSTTIEEILDEITLALSGAESDYISDGEIDQNSDAAMEFKESIASETGASVDQIEITDVESISRNGVYVSFIFIEIEGDADAASVEELMEELMEAITDAIEAAAEGCDNPDGCSFSIGDLEITSVTVDNMTDEENCPFEVDQCGTCDPDGENDCCFDDQDPNAEYFCSGYMTEDACEAYDACYWENDGDEGPYCEYDGPPNCVWDCEGICQFVKDDEESDPIVFCEWLTNTIGGDSTCSADCDDNTASDIDEFVDACQDCLNNGDGESDDCDIFGGDDCDQCHDDCNDGDDDCHNTCDTYYCGDYGDNCYDWMDPDVADGCADIIDEDACDGINECYWENNPIDGESQCQVEGPPSCVWDCEGICDWENQENDEDPLGFCAWLVNADAGGCTSDCTDGDDTEVQEYVTLCELCLASDDAESDACVAIDDGDGDCHCFSEDGEDGDCEYNDYEGCMEAECSWHCDDDDWDGDYDDCMLPCIDEVWTQNPDEDPTAFCEFMVGLSNSPCFDNCDQNMVADMLSIINFCSDCLDSNSCDNDWDGDTGDDCDQCHDECDEGNNICHDECDENYCNYYDDGPPACLEDCEGVDDWADDGPSDNPDAFCYWLTEAFVSSNCTDDCVTDEDADMITAYHNACLACLGTTDGCTDAMNELDAMYDDHCYDWMDPDVADGCSDINDQNQCNSYDECHWEDSTDSGFAGTCETEGPPSCIWDCAGICQWDGSQCNDQCEDGDNDCYNNCDDDYDPIDFCSWLVNADADGCSDDCMDDDNIEVQEYVMLCESCLESNDAESVACMSLDDEDQEDDDCHCHNPNGNHEACDFNDSQDCLDSGCSWWCDEGCCEGSGNCDTDDFMNCEAEDECNWNLECEEE